MLPGVSISGRAGTAAAAGSFAWIWKSDDGNVELVYLPTWNSSVDSAGYLFLRFNEPPKTQATIGVRSLGDGSKRWFAVDIKQDVPARLRKLAAVLKQQEEAP